MVKIQYSKKFDKKIKDELSKDNFTIHNEDYEENKIILTLDKYPSKNKALLKTDWEMI